MFALIADNTLCLKTHESTLAKWSEAGAAPFVYQAKGKLMQWSCFTPPQEALESPALMAD